jgi:Xaa-Pro aminopeptidase
MTGGRASRAHADLLISDFRYDTQLAEECPGLDVEIRGTGDSMPDALAKTLSKANIRRLGVEGRSMKLGAAETLREKLPKQVVVTTDGLVEKLREIKDREEIAEIRLAAACAERAFQLTRASIEIGQTEKQVADELEFAMRRFGAVDRAFASIVAVGPRAALPHASPGGARVGESDFVLVDWGAKYRLYRSDMTRMLVTGRITSRFERVYNTVLKAQEKAIAAIRPGISGKEVDAVARRVIAGARFGKRFGHSLGHGVGLDIHEGPALAKTGKEPLVAGMVVTVEPGIYLPGWGGIRIEDDVLVTRDGHEVLTSLPKSLELTFVDSL